MEPIQRMIVSGATKVPFFNRRVLAEMLELQSQVDLIEVDVGGGFGARGEFYPEDFLIPFAAHHLGGKVRWIEDRREHLMAMNHAREMYADLEIACRARRHRGRRKGPHRYRSGGLCENQRIHDATKRACSSFRARI